MFVTEDRFLSPMSGLFSNAGQQAWLIGELMLNLPWFIATLHESDPDVEELLTERTMFAASISQVEQWASKERAEHLKFDSVLIITPSHLNGTETWKMEPLTSVWVAEESEYPGRPVEICETKSGTRYVTSLWGASPDKLVNFKLRHQFPA